MAGENIQLAARRNQQYHQPGENNVCINGYHQHQLSNGGITA